MEILVDVIGDFLGVIINGVIMPEWINETRDE